MKNSESLTFWKNHIKKYSLSGVGGEFLVSILIFYSFDFLRIAPRFFFNHTASQ